MEIGFRYELKKYSSCTHLLFLGSIFMCTVNMYAYSYIMYEYSAIFFNIHDVATKSYNIALLRIANIHWTSYRGICHNLCWMWFTCLIKSFRIGFHFHRICISLTTAWLIDAIGDWFMEKAAKATNSMVCSTHFLNVKRICFEK